MGIIYKMLRHRDIVPHTDTDMTAPRPNRLPKKRYRSDESWPRDADREGTEQRQFGAEHILQLCKFLAEKSKRTSRWQQQQQLQQLQQQQSQHEEVPEQEHEHEQQQELDQRQRDHLMADMATAETLMLLQHQRLHEQPSSVRHPAPRALAECHSQDDEAMATYHMPQAHEKRDILLKIRRQIFERKRKRLLAHEGDQFEGRGPAVWRPW